MADDKLCEKKNKEGKGFELTFKERSGGGNSNCPENRSAKGEKPEDATGMMKRASLKKRKKTLVEIVTKRSIIAEWPRDIHCRDKTPSIPQQPG